MSESQVIDAAKSRGYTDKQIDNAIKKEKSSKTKSENSVFESTEQIELIRSWKSMKFCKTSLIEKSRISFQGMDELEIIDESNT